MAMPLQTSAFTDPGRTDVNCETDSCIVVTGRPISGSPFGGSGEPGGGYGSGSGEGGAGGGGSEPVEVAANRFNPGCQREDMVRNAIVAAAQSGTPVESTVPGTMAQLVQATRSAIEDFTTGISGGVQDPKYKDDPSWRKYKVIVEGKHYSSAEAAAAGIGTPFIIEVHYWWNNLSRQVEQAKFKNTKEQGCVGQITAVG
jgi:hypothetical protein